MATEAWITFEAGCGRSRTSRRRSALLGWDEQTYCSRKGRAARAQHSATLATLTHERDGRPGLRRRDRDARGRRRRPVRRPSARWCALAKHDRDRSVKLPADLVRALRQQASRSNEAWERARRREGLRRSGSPSSRRCWRSRSSRPRRSPTAATCTTRCSTRTSPGMTVARARPAARGAARRPRAVRPAGARPAEARTPRSWPGRTTRAAGAADAAAAARLRLRLRRRPPGHLDAPVLRRPGPHDVRMTTRYYDSLEPGALLSSMHECGHGLYEQGMPRRVRAHAVGARAVARPARVAVAVLGEHQSAARAPFWSHYLPVAKELFPERSPTSAWTTSCAASTPSRRGADPRRRRRGDLQPPHPRPLRAGARAARRPPRRRRPARGVERRATGRTSATRRKNDLEGVHAGHPLGVGRVRVLPDLHARQPLLGGDRARRCAPTSTWTS